MRFYYKRCTSRQLCQIKDGDDKSLLLHILLLLSRPFYRHSRQQLFIPVFVGRVVVVLVVLVRHENWKLLDTNKRWIPTT